MGQYKAKKRREYERKCLGGMNCSRGEKEENPQEKVFVGQSSKLLSLDTTEALFNIS
jgi:hypothetical protein